MNKLALSQLVTVFFFVFTINTFGQKITISTVELFTPSISITPENGVIEGMTEEGSVVYGFRALVGIKSPDGKIEKGEVAAGGDIMCDGSVWGNVNTSFYKVSNYVEGSEYYTRTDNEGVLLATSANQVNYKEYRKSKKLAQNWGHVLPSLIDKKTKESLYLPDTAPAETYYFTKPYVKPTGKIGYIATYTYSLESAKKAWKDSANAYQKKIATNKISHESMFKDKNVSYQGSMQTMDPVPFATNPINGNMTMFGGIKYKKVDGKENSHLQEFKLLSFNNEGALIGNEIVESENPIRINSAKVISQGEYLNRETREAKTYVFEATGDVKGSDKANAKLRSFYAVDANTGKLLNSFDVILPSIYAEEVAYINLPNSDIGTFVYFHTAAEQRGFTFVSINSAGEKVSVKSFDNNFVNNSSIPSDKLLVNTTMDILSIYEAGQDKKFLVTNLRVADETLNEGVFIFEYDSTNGITEGITAPKGLLGTFQTSQNELLFLSTTDEMAILNLFGNGSDGSKNLLGEGAIFGGQKEACLYLENKKELYLLTKTAENKGLFLHQVTF